MKGSIRQRLIALFMLLAVCELYCGSTLFLHYHIVDNTRVGHSHPFSSAHHADNKTVDDIAQLNHIVFIDDAESVDLRPTIAVIEDVCCEAPTQPVIRCSVLKSNRAPPIC